MSQTFLFKHKLRRVHIHNFSTPVTAQQRYFYFMLYLSSFSSDFTITRVLELGGPEREPKDTPPASQGERMPGIFRKKLALGWKGRNANGERQHLCISSVCRWPPPDTRSHEDGRASRPLARRMLGACATPRRGESTSVSPRCTRAGDALGVRIDSGLALDTRSQVNGRASRPLARRMLGGRMRDARAESTHERVAPLHPRWRSIGKQQVSIPVFLVLLPPDPNSE